MYICGIYGQLCGYPNLLPLHQFTSIYFVQFSSPLSFIYGVYVQVCIMQTNSSYFTIYILLTQEIRRVSKCRQLDNLRSPPLLQDTLTSVCIIKINESPILRPFYARNHPEILTNRLVFSNLCFPFSRRYIFENV